jgi:hypothetical protein
MRFSDLDTRQKQILGLVAVVIAALICIASIAIFRSRQAPAPTEEPRTFVFDLTTTPSIPTTVASTPSAQESEIWLFEGFTGEVRLDHGFEYEYGTFRNTGNGARLSAWCSAPNSPAPEINAEYKWDRNTNILIPVISTKIVKGRIHGIQTFWEPTYITSTP